MNAAKNYIQLLKITSCFCEIRMSLVLPTGTRPGNWNKKLLKPWPSRNSGCTQLENGGSFHSFVYVYQRVNLHFPMVFLWFSHFPMVFPWFSHGFPMVFPWFSHGLPGRVNSINRYAGGFFHHHFELESNSMGRDYPSTIMWLSPYITDIAMLSPYYHVIISIILDISW